MPSIPIANIPPKNTYIVSNSPQTIFVYTFPIFHAEDLNVYLIPQGDAPDDLNQILEYNVAYTVTGVGVATGGTISLNDAAPVGSTIVIVRNMSDERMNFYINTAITADALNTDIESTILMIQQNTLYNTLIGPHYNVSASPVPPTTEATGDLILPILGPSQIWVKDSTDSFIEALTLPAYPVGTVTANTGTNNRITRWAGPQVLKDSGVNLLDNDYITSLVGINLWALPLADGSDGQALITDGAGQLFWGSPSANSVEVTQVAHGFIDGDLVRLNGSVYVLAQADNAANAEVVGIVSQVIDANTFALTTNGTVDMLSGLTAGTVYFLSPTTPGALTATEPTTPGQIEKPMLIATSTTTGLFFNYRGRIIPSPEPDTVFTWTTITGDVTATPNTGYICDSSSLITITLPSTFPVNQYIEVMNDGTGMFRIAQQSGQSIKVFNASTTVGTGGYIESMHQGCQVFVICTVEDTTFRAVGFGEQQGI